MILYVLAFLVVAVALLACRLERGERGASRVFDLTSLIFLISVATTAD